MSIEQKWVVKSSDTIIGPFEFDQVVQYIFSGEIHLLDEIKGPFERWRPIKDHSLFAAAIEKLKATTYTARENTITATIDIGTQTHEITASQTASLGHTNTKTPVIRGEDLPSADSVPAHNPAQQQVNYNFPQPTKSKSPKAFLMSVILLLIGGGAYLVYEFQQTKEIEQKISAYDQLTDQAILHLKVGEYQKALRSFNKAYSISPNDPNLIIEMAPLAIQFDGRFSQTQVIIENLLVSRNQRDFKKLGKNIIGLSQSYRGRHAQAIKAYNQSLNVDDQFLPPKLNKAYSLIKLGQRQEAVMQMADVVASYPDEAAAHYMYIRSLVEVGIKSGSKEVLQEALSVANEFPQNFFDFRQEVLFLTALANMHMGVDAKSLGLLVNNFLKVDFELTNLHVHNPHFDFQSFNWLDFSNRCQKMASKLEDYEKSLLEGFCLLKVNRTIEAKNIFESLLGDRNEDGVLQALYASALLKIDELSQVKNTLGLLSQVVDKQPVVETILRGCLRADDLNCGAAIFKGRHGKHLSLLYSHWGNSAISLKKNRKKSKSSIQLGLEMSPNFAPLIQLRRKL